MWCMCIIFLVLVQRWSLLGITVMDEFLFSSTPCKSLIICRFKQVVIFVLNSLDCVLLKCNFSSNECFFAMLFIRSEGCVWFHLCMESAKLCEIGKLFSWFLLTLNFLFLIDVIYMNRCLGLLQHAIFMQLWMDIIELSFHWILGVSSLQYHLAMNLRLLIKLIIGNSFHYLCERFHIFLV